MRKTKERIIITVTDEGIGIPENVDLFAPFKRVGNQSGVGLGLYMVNELFVKNLGYKIAINNINFNYKNKDYKGTNFIINFD